MPAASIRPAEARGIGTAVLPQAGDAGAAGRQPVGEPGDLQVVRRADPVSPPSSAAGRAPFAAGIRKAIPASR